MSSLVPVTSSLPSSFALPPCPFFLPPLSQKGSCSILATGYSQAAQLDRNATFTVLPTEFHFLKACPQLPGMEWRTYLSGSRNRRKGLKSLTCTECHTGCPAMCWCTHLWAGLTRLYRLRGARGAHPRPEPLLGARPHGRVLCDRAPGYKPANLSGCLDSHHSPVVSLESFWKNQGSQWRRINRGGLRSAQQIVTTEPSMIGGCQQGGLVFSHLLAPIPHC